MGSEEQLPEIALDNDALYQEETFTDGVNGSIHRLTPVTTEGKPDSERKVRFTGHTQLMTSAGALPLSFEIDAEDLPQALEKFPGMARENLEQTIKRIEEMRREQASSLYVPGQDGGPQGGGGSQGGAPGGGLQMP